MPSSDFEITLEATAAALNSCCQDWVVIGGAAAFLHGFEFGGVQDIDIVVPNNTAAGLMSRLSLENQADRGSERFRSTYLLLPQFGSIKVEIMSGFEVRLRNTWCPIAPATRETVRVRGQIAYVPSIGELAEIFDLCGRPKDTVRSRTMRLR